MSRASDFLEQCGFFYLLTVDGDYPSGRPISRILEKDGAMYFGTRTEKAFYRQLKQNPHVGLVSFCKGQWIRIYGTASEIHDKDIREEYLVRIPMEVERFGSSENPILAVFRMDIVRAELHSPGDKVEAGISFSRQWGLYIANVIERDGKISNVVIDRLANGISSKELHDNYGIKPVSTLGKDWWEQVVHYERWIVEHGLDAVNTDEKGHAINPDLLSGGDNQCCGTLGGCEVFTSRMLT